MLYGTERELQLVRGLCDAALRLHGIRAMPEVSEVLASLKKSEEPAEPDKPEA